MDRGPDFHTYLEWTETKLLSRLAGVAINISHLRDELSFHEAEAIRKRARSLQESAVDSVTRREQDAKVAIAPDQATIVELSRQLEVFLDEKEFILRLLDAYYARYHPKRCSE
jgi:hypothetical protein